jgi:lipopolysaccharide transport system permease protein
MRVQVYESTHGESFLQLLQSIVRGCVNGHSLGFRLFVRDLKAGLEASLLGYLWIILPALASAGLWIFIQQQKIVAISDTGLPYPVFVLIGTTSWTIFAEALNKPIQRYKSSMPLMVKLNFPREALFISAIYDLIFSLSLKLIVLFVIIYLLGVAPSLSWLGMIGFTLGALFVGLAIGILIAPIGVLFTDFARGINLVMPFLMYLTPVVFSVKADSLLGKIQMVNPVTPWMEASRAMISGGDIEASSLLVWTCIAVLISIVGLMVMRIALPIIVERAGS